MTCDRTCSESLEIRTLTSLDSIILLITTSLTGLVLIWGWGELAGGLILFLFCIFVGVFCLVRFAFVFVFCLFV